MKNNYKPLVSTIIPTYKRANMLPRAIDSVLNQTYGNIEIIVVDDNNPDSLDRKNVEILMEKYSADSRVRYLKHNKNKNGSVARNTGIKNAKGKYVCFLDDDNYFYKEKVEKQIDYLQKHPEYKAVYCGLKREDMEQISSQEGDLTFEQLSGTNIIDTNMILMERSIILQFGGWDERLKRNQDVSFMLRYFKTGNKVGVVSEALAFYDIVDRSNVSKPRDNERNFDAFLNFYNEQVEACEKRIKNAKKKIYSLRYRGVLLSYLKNRDFPGAIRLYFKMLKKAPLIFNKLLITGFIKKIQRKPLF